MSATTYVTVRIDNGDPLPCTLHMTTDRIDVSTFTPPREPNPDWTFVDGAGHFHAFDIDGKLPTLREKRVEHVSRHRRLVRRVGTLRLEWKRTRSYTHTLVCDACSESVDPVWRLGSCHRTMPGRTTVRLRLDQRLPDLVRGQRVSVVVDTDRVQYFGFAQLSSFVHWVNAEPGDGSWSELTWCGPFARRKPPGAALPPDAEPRSAATPPG